MSLDFDLFKSLSNGQFQSGESLAEQLGVSRTTIWKEIQRLQEQYSIEFHSVKGRGYRLAQPIELLETGQILDSLAASTRSKIDSVEVLPVVDSTNRYLLAAASQGAKSGKVVFAEQQSLGRGRQGRTWVSPFGCNIYVSMLWQFELATQVLSGLGIVVAVAVAKALGHFVDNLSVKWPNDILYKGQKLAGILLEMQGEANGPANVVIGIGINVRMPCKNVDIDQAWTDLYRITGKPVSRNRLAAILIDELSSSIEIFEQQGLDSFVSAWPSLDALNGQLLQLNIGNRQVEGVAKGIDASGALLIETDGVVKPYMAGEASLKKPVANN